MITSSIRTLRLLLLGMWLGCAIFFGAAVAPALFGVLRDAGLPNANELAGSIVSRLLSFINTSGFEVALFLFVTAFFIDRHRAVVARSVEVISLAIMAIMTGVNKWVIAARMLDLRKSIAMPIDQVSPADPRRLSFDALHRYSVTVMGVAIVAALVAFLIASWQRNYRTKETD